MNSPQTTKEILHSILITQEERAKEDRLKAKRQLEEAAAFSDFINAQQGVNDKLLGYLESNAATNQEGAIEKLDRLEKAFNELKGSIDKKIAFFTGAGVVLISVGKWLVAKIFI